MRSLKSTHELDARLKKGMQSSARPALKHKPYFKDHFPAVVGYVYLSRYVIPLLSCVRQR